ncbi:MAG: tRNA guanosine(34) transglycosylase Tgt, partial [Patescibacteria group bacterium]|nr:tRNA guanosine(34) transglycosylase Tgt [Patescibacteria group bacterium]
KKKDASSNARAGVLQTLHGSVLTPAFVPVGTQATVKSLTPEDLERIGVQILFGNTYHLHLRPGEEIVEQFGGLGEFMGFSGTTMTDSGGFQVFSLARGKVSTRQGEADEQAGSLVNITEDGVEFRSHLDGSTHFFTPEQSIAIQKKLGADICLSFDDCAPFPVTYEGAKAAMERTHRWAKRSLEAFRKTGGKFEQGLYGIVQGSVFEDLRKASAQAIGSLNFDGFAIGGVSVGESKEDMVRAVEWAMPLLPENRVKHLLGVGDVDDIFYAVERGIDTMDCVTPTRLGRVGHIFVAPSEGTMENRFRLDITKSIFAQDQGPLTQGCECYVCAHFTRGYVNHLFRAKEMLGGHLATYHNVYFMISLVKQIREAIITDRFSSLKQQWLG